MVTSAVLRPRRSATPGWILKPGQPTDDPGASACERNPVGGRGLRPSLPRSGFRPASCAPLGAPCSRVPAKPLLPFQPTARAAPGSVLEQHASPTTGGHDDPLRNPLPAALAVAAICDCWDAAPEL